MRGLRAKQQHLPFPTGLWQSGALLWMGSPLVDGTCTSICITAERQLHAADRVRNAGPRQDEVV
jgi:hypothetical protein